MRRLIRTVVLAGLFIAFHRDADAQLFSNRTFGSSLQPQTSAGGGSFGGPTPAPGVGSPAGTSAIATPEARFMRKNRTAASFVGKDAADSRKVVGAAQFDGAPGSQSAALELFERRVPESLLNPARTPVPRTRMYEPKLTVAFRHVPRADAEISSSLQGQVVRLTQTDPSLRVTMSVEGQTARLDGEVGSEEMRSLIEQMVLFEPGISAVQNDLRVLSAAP